MAINHVSHSVVEMFVGAVDRCDVPLPELCEGLAIDPKALRRRLGGLDWDLFVELLDRLEGRVGYTRLEACLAHVPDIAPDTGRLLSYFTSPRLLIRFIGQLMGPSMYPMFRTAYDEQEHPDGRVTAHITMELRTGFRDCATLFKINVAGQSALPCLIGLPPIEVRAVTGPRGGQYWLSVPPSQTLFAKLSAAAGWNQTPVMNEELARQNLAHEQLWRRRDTDFRVKLDEASKRWALSDREVQVVSGLARGLSSRELARDLGCGEQTVETHVAEVLERAGLASRLALVATFWREL